MEETGQVFISVKEGKSFALSEPTDIYCIIQLEQQKVRTSICASVPLNGRAEWSEGYTFDVTTDADVVIKVWGQSARAPHGRLLGTATIDHACAKNRAPVERWVPIKPPSDAPNATAGEIYFRTSYVNSTSRVGLADFTVLKLIGRGAFGRVMLVRKNDTGRLYAMKQLSKDHVLSLAAVTFTLTERNVLKTYNHPFVVSLKFSFQTKGHLYMVLDYVGGGELFYHMAERGVFDEDTVRFYAAQIILALGFLHDHAVTYRDLKPENLLLDIHGNICLCDFGLCKEQVDGENTFTLCGSPEYMAPEVLQGKGYGKSVDWWALGILIYEMLTGLPPFYSEDPVEMGQNILAAPIHFPDHLSKNIMGLIVQLLRRDPARRLGAGPNDADDIKAHPFFASVDWKKMLRKELEPPFKPHLHGTLDVTYFDPNCTEMPIAIAVPSSMTDDAANSVEDCFAQFSFVAPSDLGSTPHQLRKLTVSPTPLSFSHLGALHSSSPVFSHSAAHTPTLPHPLQGGGIPRSQATFSLSNFATSIPSRNASPHSFSLEDGEKGIYEGSPPVFSSTPVRNFTPLHNSQPLPSNTNNSQTHPLHSSHPPINNPQPQHLPEPKDAPFPPRDPAHPLRDIVPPSRPPDLYQEDLPPHPVEEPSPTSFTSTPWTPSHPPLPSSLSSPTITTNTPPVTPPTTPRHLRFPLAASASSPDLLHSRQDDKKEDKSKKDDKSGKKLGFVSSLFRKMK